MTAYILRPARPSEKEVIFESYRRTVGQYVAQAWGWDESYQRNGFWNHHPLEEFKVVEMDGELAGGLHVVEQETALHVRMIFLLPAFQHLGIGSALIRHVQERAGKKKCVCLKVISCNPAKALYKRLGFKTVDENDSLIDMQWIGSSLADIHGELGISRAVLLARGLRECEEAERLEVAECGADGREHRLVGAAAEAWRILKAAAVRDGVSLFIVSAFRSIDRQAEIIRRKLDTGTPLYEILSVCAPPGFSEHHTGRAIDVSTPGTPLLDVAFDQTPAFAWLTEHAHGFGFRLSCVCKEAECLEVHAMPTKLLFLPGALGRTQFWLPVAGLLTHPAQKVHFGWPGFGGTPPDPSVNGIDDLVATVVAAIDQPTALVAQSMGGVIAVRAALEKADLVTHLVLTVTSGGVDVASLGGEDWRPSFHESNPSLPRWFSSYQEDLTPELKKIQIPVLLLWGDADSVSPVSVGQRLASLLPRAELHVFPGGGHDLANTLARDISPIIDQHLSNK